MDMKELEFVITEMEKEFRGCDFKKVHVTNEITRLLERGLREQYSYEYINSMRDKYSKKINARLLLDGKLELYSC